MRTVAGPGSVADDYAAFVRRLSRGGGKGEPAPATLEGWDRRLSAVRAGLERSLGRMPQAPCPLDPEVLGTIPRAGYAIERLTFQSRPGVRVTANLYRPDPVQGRYPGVVSVHGHWPWARMDPHVQPRCIGLARLGYVVLGVDAFGAGERAVEPGPGTYHGGLLGASLWPVGTPLIGLQVYDNRRAVDYLISRAEVDPSRLAITGASGGGNQTLYAGATDERLAAVIPVCGIGTYDAYLTTACCVCEVNPAGAAYATAGDLLAMIAPRALLVISATRDAFQFSVAEAAKSVGFARDRFRILGQGEKIRHAAIESAHDYNQAMRETVYGWVEQWLRGRGDGRPVAEPPLEIEEVEALRCYPQGTPRPKTIVTIPEFARREGLDRLAVLPRVPDHPERWNADAERMRVQLRDRILGGFPPKVPWEVQASSSAGGVEITIMTEPGIRSWGWIERPRAGGGEAGTAIVMAAGARSTDAGAIDERERSARAKIRASWDQAGYGTVELSRPRGTGPWLAKVDSVAGVADHDVAEWGLWVGRPLLGQWVWDTVRWLDLLDELRGGGVKAPPGIAAPVRPYVLVGVGAMSIPAILAGALDARVAGVACSDCLVSFVGREARPWTGVPMGLLAPNLLDVGDVAHLAALVAPRPLGVSHGVEPEGAGATPARLREAFAFTRGIYQLLGAAGSLTLGPAAEGPSFIPRS